MKCHLEWLRQEQRWHEKRRWRPLSDHREEAARFKCFADELETLMKEHEKARRSADAARSALSDISMMVGHQSATVAAGMAREALKHL